MPFSLVASAGSMEPTGEIGLRAIRSALMRRRAAWLLPPLAAFLAIGLFVNVVPPRYTAQTQVRLGNRVSNSTLPARTGGSSELTGPLDEAAVATQVQLIRSSGIAGRAIRALHLEGNTEFGSLAGGLNPIARVSKRLGIFADPVRETAEAHIEHTFARKLTVSAAARTGVATIEFTSRDPQLAARAVNEVAALYLDEQSSAERSAVVGGSAISEEAQVVGARVAELRVKLADADAAREHFRLSSGLPNGSDATTFGNPSFKDIGADLSRARAQQADAQAKAALIRDLLRDGRAADVADVTNSAIIRQIWSQRSAAQTQLATEARTLLPEHPRVKELAAQLKDYDAALKSAAKQMAASLENDAEAAGQRVAKLETALAQQKSQAAAASGAAVEVAALDRVAQGLKDQLQSATARYEEIVARQTPSAAPTHARIISRAVPPREPSFPKKLPFLVVGTAATLAFALVWVVAGEILARRAHVEGMVGSASATSRPAAERAPVSKEVPRRRASDFIAAATAMKPGDKFGIEGPADATPEQQPRTVAEWGGPPPGPASSALAPRGPSRGRTGEDLPDEVVLAPVTSRSAGPSATEPARRRRLDPRRWGRAVVAYATAFGRPAAETGVPARSATAAPMSPSNRALAATVGWDQEDVPSRLAQTGSAPDRTAENVARHIVDSHVPGRGLHVVGAGIGGGAAAERVIVLARMLADKGRSIIVDLNATPAGLATMGGGGGLAAVTVLDGLAELLAGEASFAEVIHRDHATRLHFIPTGRKEADFRDFDLILDALTETYDFIVLLTPALPRSEIAKVMAPFADIVVLSAGDDADDSIIASLRDELAFAGAGVVLTMTPRAVVDRQAVA